MECAFVQIRKIFNEKIDVILTQEQESFRA